MNERFWIQSLPTLKNDWYFGLIIKNYYKERTLQVETIEKKKKKIMCWVGYIVFGLNGVQGAFN